MICKDNVIYLLYDEIKDYIINELKQDLLNREYKFIGDIDKVSFSRKRIYKELDKRGYLNKRIQSKGVRSLYFYKPYMEKKIED